MVAPQWLELSAVLRDVDRESEVLFPPFADSFRVLGEILYHTDADDVKWISTESGAHIPLNEEGEAVGGAEGALNGKDFGNAESTNSESTTPPENGTNSSGELNDNSNQKVNSTENPLPIQEKSTIINIESESTTENENVAGTNNLSGASSKGANKAPKGFEVGAKEDLDKAVKSGRAKMSLKAFAQSKHHKGTKKYNDAVAQGKKVSTLSIDDNEVISLVTKYSGSGTVYINRKTGQIKETIDCGKTVGEYISKSGKTSQTTRLTVHHSKDGYHAVPASSGGKNE